MEFKSWTIRSQMSLNWQVINSFTMHDDIEWGSTTNFCHWVKHFVQEMCKLCASLGLFGVTGAEYSVHLLPQGLLKFRNYAISSNWLKITKYCKICLFPHNSMKFSKHSYGIWLTCLLLLENWRNISNFLTFENQFKIN